MSKLDDLIQEYCPDGVEYKPLWSLTAWDKRFNAVSRKKQAVVFDYHYYLAKELKELIRMDGDVKILTTNTTDFFTDESLVEENVVNREVIAIPWGGNPNVQYYNGKFITADNRIATSLNPKILDNKFLYYYMQNKLDEIGSFYRGSGIKHPNMAKVLDFQVPLPALPVQREIVRILDEFTLLSAELSAELAARKKQYEYYRDTLLNNNAEIPKIKLGEFAVISRGGNFQKKDFVDNGLPCIHYGQIYTHYGTYADTTLTTINEEAYSKSKKAKKNDIVMAVTSENIEDVCKSVAWLGDKDIAVSGHTAIISHQQNAKYLSYYFSSNAFFKQKKKLAHGTKVIEVTPNTLANIEVPLPSLEVQNRLVEVLDNFDSICSDLNIGLPAEIEARQKQYEFYRDQLLTFAENGNTILTNNEQRTTNNEGI